MTVAMGDNDNDSDNGGGDCIAHTIINEIDGWFHFTASFPFQTKQRQIDELVNGFRTL